MRWDTDDDWVELPPCYPLGGNANIINTFQEEGPAHRRIGFLTAKSKPPKAAKRTPKTKKPKKPVRY
jgi:hypothetical protein